MDGRINSAKAKLWDIVNNLATAKPTPDLRVALYSYGHTSYNPQAGWVRKEADLTTDLDEISKKLFGLTTNGGEEYVGRVLEFRITRYGENGRNIVLSRRVLLEAQAAGAAEETRKKVVPGAVLAGTVASLADFGAFVDLGGIQGLVPLSELSMGTTHDFEVAVEEGATLVRVGTALFGERPA